MATEDKTDNNNLTQRQSGHENMQLGVLSNMVGYYLRRAQTSLFQHFSKRLGRQNITPGQFGLLVKIKNNPGISQTALAKADGIERSTLGEIIDRFEKRQLVERRKHVSDRRTYALHLTASGEQFLDIVIPEAMANNDEMTRHFSQSERETLIVLLKKLIDSG